MGGGGVSGGLASTAASRLGTVGATGTANAQQQYEAANRAGGQVTPFFTNMMTKGLPGYRMMTDYAGGDIAQAFAPQRAAALRSLNQSFNLPSGYRTSVINNLNEAQGRAFDSSLRQAWMANQMAKQQGAAGLQGEQQIAGNQALGWGSQGAQADQSLLYGPRAPSVWGTIGGLGMQGLKTAAAMA